jgi:hypothetical protein
MADNVAIEYLDATWGTLNRLRAITGVNLAMAFCAGRANVQPVRFGVPAIVMVFRSGFATVKARQLDCWKHTPCLNSVIDRSFRERMQRVSVFGSRASSAPAMIIAPCMSSLHRLFRRLRVLSSGKRAAIQRMCDIGSAVHRSSAFETYVAVPHCLLGIARKGIEWLPDAAIRATLLSALDVPGVLLDGYAKPFCGNFDRSNFASHRVLL